MAIFAFPTIPWPQAQQLQLAGLNQGPGLEDFDLVGALQRLCVLLEVHAVVAFGSRGRGDAQRDPDQDLTVIAKQAQLNPQAKLQLWKQWRSGGLGSCPL